jgi:hypothetical protein
MQTGSHDEQIVAVRVWLRLVLIATLAVVCGVNARAGDISAPLSIDARAQSEAPLTVAVGIEVEQITSIDQKAENFGVVATVRMQWEDEKLAGAAVLGDRSFATMPFEDFRRLADEHETLVPNFVFDNQQGPRWQQEAIFVVSKQGLVEYFERSALILQAPYFDFTEYPFDTQKFYVEITSVLPKDFVSYVPLDQHSGLGDLLGEEAWILENAELLVLSDTSISGEPSAKIALEFSGRRQLQYYFLRIFLPLGLLVAVTWASFFLEDYKKRIDVGGANLLVFVAFNFTISESLPQLGYLTFLDFILQWIFVVTTAIILLNVALSRMQIRGREALASQIDNYVVKWVFPMAYAVVVVAAVYLFLL